MMRKRARNSVFFRLFMAALLVLIPMNLLLMLYAVFLFNNVRASARTEQKNVMEMYMLSLDTVADQITSSFYRIISDEDMLRLMQSDAGKSPDNVEWYAARTRVMDRYTQWLQDYPLLDGVFSYYDYRGKGENTWAICSQNPNPVMYINDHIIGLLEERLETAKRMGEDYRGCPWEYCSIEDGDYLIRIWRRNNCYYGCWFNLDCVLERFYGNSGEAGQMFFMDQEGNICTSGYTGSARGKKQDVYVPSKSTGIVLVLPEDSRAVIYSMPKIVLIFFLLAVLALTALPLLVFVTRRYILKPMNHLLDAMEELRKGNLDYQIPRTKITGEFAVLEESFNLMTRQLHDTKIAAYEGELERQRIQMRYLSQQIQPHFVLNTLNILYSYEAEEYPLIQKMLMCLSKYFRYIVKVHSDFVELDQELGHIKNYFEIQEARYPERFDYYVEAQEGTQHMLIPPLLIQNFTENAIKYSISMDRKVSIYVLVEFYGRDKMRIRIADTGRGLSEKVMAAIARFRENYEYQEELGVGIQNAIERLDILYRGIPKIEFYNSISGGATIDIIMPCRVKDDGEESDNADCISC